MDAVINGELAKLYALRAGISQIAVDNDNVNSIEEQRKNDSKPTLKKVKDAKTSISNAKKGIERIQADIEKHNRIEGKMDKIRALKKTVKGIRFAVVAGMLILVCVLYFLLIFGKAREIWMQILFFGGAVVLFGIVAKTTWHFTGEYYYDTYDHKIDVGYETRDYEKTKWSKTDFQNNDTEIERLTVGIKQDEELITIYNGQLAKIEEKAKITARPCYIRADAVHKGLIAEFSSFIDERDWENLDLIIFAFETGRADNLKEALKFIDEERRANQIVSAVNNATQQICKTINTGFRQMSQVMTLCFERLSAQIQANANKQLELMSSMNEKLDGVHAQLGSVVKGIDYNNALLKKQNESSEKMMREIRPFLKNANMLMAGELGIHYTETVYS